MASLFGKASATGIFEVIDCFSRGYCTHFPQIPLSYKGLDFQELHLPSSEEHIMFKFSSCTYLKYIQDQALFSPSGMKSQLESKIVLDSILWEKSAQTEMG